MYKYFAFVLLVLIVTSAQLKASNGLIEAKLNSDTCSHTVNIVSDTAFACNGDRIVMHVPGFNFDDYSFQWSVNDTLMPTELDTFSIAYTSGYYQVAVFDTNNCSVKSDSLYLEFDTLQPPSIQLVGTINHCTDDTIQLDAGSGYTSYQWLHGDSVQNTSASSSGIYEVEVTNAIGCKQSNTYYLNLSTQLAPDICVVTVDTAVSKHKIIWNKPVSAGIDSFKLYRCLYTPGNYELVGALTYQDSTVFVDTSSYPEWWPDQYEMTLVDTCGVESAPGVRHKTMHLKVVKGSMGTGCDGSCPGVIPGTCCCCGSCPGGGCGGGCCGGGCCGACGTAFKISWNHCEGASFSSYSLYRGSSPSNMTMIMSTSSMTNFYWDDNAPPGLNYYLLELLMSDDCFPDSPSGMPYGSSLSNIAGNGESAILEQKLSKSNTLLLFPNPNKGEFQIQSLNNESLDQVRVYDAVGSLKSSKSVNGNNRINMNISDYSKGLYYVEVSKLDGTREVHKVIKK